MFPPTRWLMFVLVVAFLTWGAEAKAQDPEDRKVKDCGVNSLYLLLKLGAVETDLARLLPDTHPSGVSMTEIQAASRREGMVLHGQRLGPGDPTIDRPIIALLRLKPDEDQGHFVVVQPVGTLGKSVMILDFPHPPRVQAFADLVRWGGWTGLVLVPATAWERFGPGTAAVVGAALLTLGLAKPTARWARTCRGPRGNQPIRVGCVGGS